MAGAAHPPRRQKTNRPKSSWLGAAEPDLGREWGREDSNLRRLSRRVYSPFPLATRAHPRERGIVAARLREPDRLMATTHAGKSSWSRAARPDFLAERSFPLATRAHPRGRGIGAMHL